MKNTNFNSNNNFIIYYNFFHINFNTKVQLVNYYNKIQSQNHKKEIKDKTKIIIIINILFLKKVNNKKIKKLKSVI